MESKWQTNSNYTFSDTTWKCKYHIVFALKYTGKILYIDKKLEIERILREMDNWKRVYIINISLELFMYVTKPYFSIDLYVNL